MTNVIINARLEDLLDRLDARAYVAIYTSEKDTVFTGKVFEVLASPTALQAYGQKKVTGIVVTCGYVNILIGET